MTEVPVPNSVRRLMAEIGPKWASDIPRHVDAMLGAFTPLLATCPKEGVTVERELAYGTHPKQRLDVFAPRGARGAPVIVFVHGGAFVRGDRNETPEIYSNVSFYFARNGLLGINAGYRLAPEFSYPSGAQDVGGAVAWARANAARYGGDPQRIFLAGHSAGGAHVASYAYDASLQPSGGPGLAGVVIISGRVRADPRPDDPNAAKLEAYYGTDVSLYAERSGVTHAPFSALPTMIAAAQYENPFLDVYCAELFCALSRARKRSPRFVQLAGHNHLSIVAHFNTAEDALGREILDFVARGA